MMDKVHDVFIAYHGSYDAGGSRGQAESLYSYLLTKKLDVYFFPASGKDNYKANIVEAMRSKTFVLVCNQNIHTVDGHIDRAQHYELSVEIDAFYSLAQEGQNTNMTLAKVFVCGDYTHTRGQEQFLHELFNNRTHLFCDESKGEGKYEEVYSWIVNNISNTQSSATDSVESYISQEIKKVYAQRSSMNGNCNLSQLIQNSKSIRAMGISNTELTSRVDAMAVTTALKNGAHIELLFLDPDSSFTRAREEEEKLRKNRIRDITRVNIDTARNFKSDLPQQYKEQYKLYMYRAVPRLNIILLDDVVILQYYANFAEGLKNPCFYIVREQNSPLYDFCVQNFELIKENAKPLGEGR